MDKAKRAQTAETPKQPSLGLKLRAPYLYPDRADSATFHEPLKNLLSKVAVRTRDARASK